MKLPSFRKIKKTWLVFALAVVIGLAAALATRSFLRTQLDAIETRSRHDTVAIVVAKAEIPKGGVISRQNLAVRAIPLEYAHSGAVRPDDFERIDGKVIAYTIKSGEMILWSQMESKRVPTFSARVEPGKRAMTFVVDEINSISGMLEPGDLIDLMFTNDRDGKKVILPLLQSVEVMATGQRSIDDVKSGERSQFATVTLNTTPDQAKNIILARDSGKLTALLRNPEDKKPIGDKGYDLAALFGTPQESRRVSPGRGIPVLYGGSSAKFPPDALRLGPSRGPVDAQSPPPTATAPIPPPAPGASTGTP
ncbi:Flp pilus assembly protein CpaB [Rugamonas sp. CCM 8940]|uniref:Flp pilus assembly protein CpaB n=1 Tax=Rugamonas sp. CCM 8940 TaxID=2765359 RepID=UPI0018F73D05|nr:Flp pilus assembly protein CpaB [Rugamonas sp. CCM 8940]MBJ7311282.1 Flp pilus assembly protein CpaB [Rugamonas sp. CCM 8940]